MNEKPVLYAEDDENDAYFIQRAWKVAGIHHPLVVVPDGQSAVDYLGGAGRYAARGAYPPPCLTLLDINMGLRSGLDVLKWIRAQPNLCALPAIMLTSSSADSDIHRAYIQGANGFLVKPGAPNELLPMVKAIRDYWLTQNRAVADTRRPAGAQLSS